MSGIDERVVQMQFNNQQFEKGVQSTIKSLDGLKQGLNLEGASKGLEGINTTSKGINFATLSNGLDAVSMKFSALGIVGVTILQNITNSAIATGKRMIQALTTKPIIDGFKEYELKMDSVQTIMNGTGASLEDVSTKLDELNTYADRTIYSFSDMTSNIGKFTNAGVGLDDAVGAIQGVANAAALSGANATNASHAMYNFAQALAAGHIKLIDWKSIETANMATVEFKTQLLEAGVAAGTLTKSADGMYNVMTSNGLGSNMKGTISATRDFNDSLAYQWMTTEVLVGTLGKYADETTDIGKRAFQAATEVKTLTQLFDTMQEAVGSGWAQSWEIIIGDFHEAKAVLTEMSQAFDRIVGSSADSRNALLAGWKDLGGRAALIDGLRTAMQGLAAIIKPIQDAFRDIFPATTSEQLANITYAFQHIMERLAPSEKTVANLQRTFKGLFAVLDIGREVLFAVGKALYNAFDHIIPVGDGLLGFTATLGDFVVGLRDTIKESDIINKVFEGIGTVVGPIAELVGGAIRGIIDSIKALGGGETDGVVTFADKVGTAFGPVIKIFDLVKGVFSKIGDLVTQALPFISKAFKAVGGVIKDVMGTITDAFRSNDMGSMDMVNGGIFAMILLGIRKFINSLTEITSGGFLKGIVDIVDGVKDSLASFQSTLKSKTLLTIASAIAILAGALTVLALLDPGKLSMALGAITVLFVDLFGAMTIFEKAMKGEQFKALSKVSKVLIPLSISVLILAVAMKKLADLDWDGVAKGLVGISALSGVLVIAAKELSKVGKKLTKGLGGLIAFAIAINILASAVKKLGDLSPAELAKGLVGVGVLMTELSLFLKTADLDGIGMFKGLGIMLLATALNIMANAVSKIGEMDTGAMTQGLIGIGIILTELALFSKITADTKGLVGTAIGLTILGGALLIMGSAIEKVGSLSGDVIAKGLLAIAVSLGIIAGAMHIMPNNILGTSAAILLLSVALIGITNALVKMGGMSWESIAKGLVTLAGALGIIAAGMHFMTSALPGAAALLVVAGALALLAPTLILMGSVPISTIGKSLLFLSGILAVFGVGAMLLTPVIPMMAALAGVLALLGVAVALVGGGLLALSIAMTAIAVGGQAGVVAFKAFAVALLSLIPALLEQIGLGIVAFANVIADGAPAIIGALTAILVALAKAAVEFIPVMADVILEFLKAIMKVIVDFTPILVSGGAQIILDILTGIRDSIPKIVTVAIEIIVAFVDGITSMVGTVIQAGVDLILAFINGLADAIENNTTLMIEAIDRLFTAIVDAGIAVLKASIEKFKTNAKTIMDSGFMQGIKDKFGDLVTTVKEIPKKFIDTIMGKLADFKTLGGDMMKGLASGIGSSVSKVADAAKEAASTALSRTKAFLKIKSPSRAFRDQIGKPIADGMAEGITKHAPKAATASERMSEAIFKASQEWSNKKTTAVKDTAKTEIEEGKKVVTEHKAASKEKQKVDKASSKVKKNAQKTTADSEIKWIKEQVKNKKISAKEEEAAWKRLQDKYKAGTKERKKVDAEYAKTKDALGKRSMDESIKYMDEEKYYKRLTLEQELANWERIQKRYDVGSENRKKADREVYRLKNELRQADYESSKKWIDKEKQHKRLALLVELEAWERVQARYEVGSKERIDADKEVFRVRQELIERQKTIDKEYYDGSKEIHAKLKDDIQELTDEFERAVTDRAQALTNAWGLFDKVDRSEEPIDGQELMDNLEDQVRTFSRWQKQIDVLSQSGIAEGLLQELRDLGPKSLDHIEALNRLSGPQLDKYSELWRKKHELARTQATLELVGLRDETNIQIKALEDQSEKDLEILKATWQTKTSELANAVVDQYQEMGDDIIDGLRQLNGRSKTEIMKNNATIEDTINRENWMSLGVNITEGIIKGMNSKERDLMDASASLAQKTKEAAEKELGVKSPSRVFMAIGTHVVNGFTQGILQNGSKVVGSITDMGRNAVSTMSSVISEISEVIDADMDVAPTIRPVIDVTDITQGLDRAFGQTRSFDMAARITRAKTGRESQVAEANSAPNTDTTNITNEYTIHATIREESDIRKVSQELLRTQKKYFRGRGVLTQ